MMTGMVLLTLLAWLWPGPTRSLDLDWLAGGWHNGDNPSLRLLWSRPDSQRVNGMLLDGPQTTLLSLDNSGHLIVRTFDRELRDEGSPQEFTLLEQQPQQLRFNHDTALAHLSGRSEASELKLELHGRSWTFQRD